MREETSEAELAWLAGLLEGEGSFLIARCHKGGRVYLYPKITVNMTDHDVVEHAARLLGGNGVSPLPPSKQSRRKQAWRASVTGQKAAILMRELRPRMGSRRGATIDRVLAEYDAREPTQVRRRRACSEAAARRTRRLDGTFEGAA